MRKPRHRDKQLHHLRLTEVLQRREIGQALNAKQFALLAGISYSAARSWFRLPGFPVFQGVVFWQDFVEWRQACTGLREPKVGAHEAASRIPQSNASKLGYLPPKAL